MELVAVVVAAEGRAHQDSMTGVEQVDSMCLVQDSRD